MDYSEYVQAKKLGEKEYRSAVLKGAYPFLPALDEILNAQSQTSQNIGVVEIPLSLVIGTKTTGRQNSFAANYMPLLEEDSEFAMKWMRLYEAQMEEGIRDPLKVYEYMKKFYVQEGNKRVSVMKYLDMPSFEAEVIRILPEKSEDPEVKLYYEFLDFYKVCPIYEISFSHSGNYRTFASIVDEDLEHAWKKEKVRNVEASYYRFLSVFEAEHGNEIGITAGDAMLIYLSIYGYSSLLDAPKKELIERMRKLKGEFRIHKEGTSFVESPENVSRRNLFSLFSGNLFRESHPLKVSFLYDADTETSGLVSDQEIGRYQVEHTHEGIVKTTAHFNVSDETQLKKVIEEDIADGCNMIFTNSPWMMQETLRQAIACPSVHFLNCSMNFNHQAVRTFQCRMYEAKFLLGAVAASLCDNHKLGYVASIPVYGEIANINAFAQGAAMVDPKAQVYLAWADVKQNDFQSAFEKNDVRMISGLDNVDENTTAYGLFEVQKGMAVHLASPVSNWGNYYDLMIQTVLNNTYDDDPTAKKNKAVNYWYGMSADVVGLVLSKRIPYATRKLAETLQHAMLEGLVSPFQGELYSQDAKIQDETAGKMRSEEIIEMNWLNANVIGNIPSIDAFTKEAQKVISVAGVHAGKDRI